MNTNENIRNDTREDVIELGSVSIETKGEGIPGLEGLGHKSEVGISE